MNLIELTQKLISIPSFVDKNTNEKNIGDFIYNYLEEIPFLKISKQEIGNGRFNIVAKDNYPARILISCHMDTVEPSSKWECNAFDGKIENNRIYGLGSCDMKGGTACVLNAVKSLIETKGLVLLFYCDEEYDFDGMKKFVENFDDQLEAILTPEPTNMEIVNGCKGVMEIFFRIKGKSGHPARPEEGNNSVEGIQKIISAIKEEVNKYNDSILGPSLLNIAYILGGSEKQGKISDRGNNIPDTAEAVLDIRTSSSELNSKKIKEIIAKEALLNGLNVEKIEVRSDLAPVKSNRLNILEESIEEECENSSYGDIKKQGYFDGGIIANKCFSSFACFGPRGGNEHQAGEWVDIDSLEKTRNIYKNLITKLCT